MTFREKLRQERPEYVDKCFSGGCRACPNTYRYDTSGRCVAHENGRCDNDTDCAACWDREIPDAKPTKPRGIVYLSGPITGVPNYWEAFEKAEDQLTSLGWAVLSPAKHPQGLTNEQYMRMDFAMIDVADVVLILPGWSGSEGARLELSYCEYIKKPVTCCIDKLEEVLKNE